LRAIQTGVHGHRIPLFYAYVKESV
jgi:hypothetical protein